MIINYQKVPHDLRDDVRIVSEKGHAPYIIHLLLRRYSIENIPNELLKLNLSSVRPDQLKTFFRYVVLPTLETYELDKYYKVYSKKYKDTKLTITETFVDSDRDRRKFIEHIVVPMGCSVFFSNETRDFYSGSIPVNPDGKKIIETYTDNWLDILSHAERYIIDNFLLEGRTPEEVSKHFEDTRNEIIDPEAITAYQHGFMNAELHNITNIIAQMESQIANIHETINNTKRDESMSYGERSVIIGRLKSAEKELSGKLKKMKSLHNSGAFASATLEYINMRDILADILQRTHKRFVMMDARTDDDVVVSLSRLASTIDRMTNRIIEVDAVVSSVETRSITDEMLEVITPELDRIEEEERQAIAQYKRILNKNVGGDDSDIEESTEDEYENILGME